MAPSFVDSSVSILMSLLATPHGCILLMMAAVQVAARAPNIFCMDCTENTVPNNFSIAKTCGHYHKPIYQAFA